MLVILLFLTLILVVFQILALAISLNLARSCRRGVDLPHMLHPKCLRVANTMAPKLMFGYCFLFQYLAKKYRIKNVIIFLLLLLFMIVLRIVMYCN